jgi:hypothetical protein
VSLPSFVFSAALSLGSSVVSHFPGGAVVGFVSLAPALLLARFAAWGGFPAVAVVSSPCPASRFVWVCFGCVPAGGL